MADKTAIGKRSVGWMGLQRGHKARPFEWLAEKAIFLVSLTTILMVFLIFVFVAREALPVFLGRMSNAATTQVIPAADMDKIPAAQLQQYLGLTAAQFASMSHDTKLALMESKAEE